MSEVIGLSVLTGTGARQTDRQAWCTHWERCFTKGVNGKVTKPLRLPLRYFRGVIRVHRTESLFRPTLLTFWRYSFQQMFVEVCKIQPTSVFVKRFVTSRTSFEWFHSNCFRIRESKFVADVSFILSSCLCPFCSTLQCGTNIILLDYHILFPDNVILRE